jgi:hypothetical protein
VLVGAVGPFIPPKWGFIVTFLFLVVALLKTSFFEGGSLFKRIAGNLITICIIAALLAEVWHLLPRPQEPLTSGQVVETWCKRSPWLCAPPDQSQPQQTTTVVPPTTNACRLKFAIATSPVARLYSRHEMPSASKANLTFDFQELFYEWKATLSVPRKFDQLTIKIDHLTEADVVSLSPASQATVQDAKPEWFSGFSEPVRTRADYYSRVIVFNNLSKGDALVVSLRRALQAPQISPVNAVRIVDARARDCSASALNFDENAAADAFNLRARALAEFKYGQVDGPPRPLPLGRDPGDVGKDEMQATIEARCRNDSCTQMVASHLEVHTGRVAEHPVTVTVNRQH